MALNKSMHPRNRYKDKPPDFTYLASRYTEFQQHVHTSLTGKVSLNFKDPEAVRALTCTLLKEDFGLTIDIPLERLIPTVPLRLNYIHWVEDLIGSDTVKSKLIRGIDIGTGASCIYPLLGATMNGWFFLATEVDDMCFNYAKKNVEQNNLSDLIKVVKVPQKTLLMDALKEESEIVYDFCMCNPPFFANQLEAKGVNSRNPSRPPPSSVNTGGITEIMAEGGELEFVKRIIHDSLQLKKRLRWYSCMLGKKCSLAPLKEELRQQEVPKVTHTEFCQGRTMRWALAWSFYDDVIMPSPPSKKRKLEKPRKPITFIVLESTIKELKNKVVSSDPVPTEDIEVVTTGIEKILAELKVLYKRVPCGKGEVSLFLTAIQNSWVHVRRKKRDRVRQLRELPRATPNVLKSTEADQTTEKQCSTNIGSVGDEEESDLGNSAESNAEIGKTMVVAEEELPVNGGNNLLNKLHVDQENNVETEEKCSQCETSFADCKTDDAVEQEISCSTMANPEGEDTPKESGGCFLFKCLMNVKKDGKNGRVEMHWVEGQNRDLMNQLSTYLRNQIFRLVVS
ncbi:RNA N6-adenosine-methyltransferase mettl16 isoform X1 [Carcharodon carcharias]|uniref:RNA N6-adenosine-methyltransferase mettl16 isoform X1 n=1 Tax=Carcharodon carcharias TaxID=13397 RepID=UPI001B7E7CF7|nr:RNA N6-adenosine-methyltransferase mettl16 isoform X1 [Carcharodon carcharias]XP_041052905.1 RNA N6-adenosine-methyltransferase mettl16 isoform X1 [Carcharodon carcharias]XP_041052906.1 RNA N6-adenosine-methyltransferase mettl16 isoform X1 [Carcharodon carcharias]XP_041052907.1 RNA N6-adenosine-methyltransferase mettl16 isoform X1 [Carcharodon carcharias]XP_041052908.1 RNA N6-adenosine-methyltransferase mettl16 isoform X1 [Carcharodon carcharias]XP_041052909.1 RNA N6-adenosine-methyltransfe